MKASTKIEYLIICMYINLKLQVDRKNRAFVDINYGKSYLTCSLLLWKFDELHCKKDHTKNHILWDWNTYWDAVEISWPLAYILTLVIF